MNESPRPESPHKLEVFEGNETMLFVERLRNQNLVAKLVELIYRSEHEFARRFESGELVLEQTSWGTMEYKENGKHVVVLRDPRILRTREEITTEVCQLRDEVAAVTRFSPDPGASGVHKDYGDGIFPRERIYLRTSNGSKLSPRAMSITEAHEKGHVVRYFEGDFTRSFFAPAFNLSQFSLTDAEYQDMLHGMEVTESEYSRDEATKEMYEYLFSGPEIMERMAQLKNFFGFDGDQEFTSEHLAFVRAEYVKRTGFDNQMSTFLARVTPETEPEFLRLINVCGA